MIIINIVHPQICHTPICHQFFDNENVTNRKRRKIKIHNENYFLTKSLVSLDQIFRFQYILQSVYLFLSVFC